MAHAGMQKRNIGKPDEIMRSGVDGLIRKEIVALQGVEARRVTFDVGARTAKTCLLPHVAYVLSGQLGVRMTDGSEEIYGPEDVMMLPPGHDAWTVGNQPCVFVELSRGSDYYAAEG